MKEPEGGAGVEAAPTSAGEVVRDPVRVLCVELDFVERRHGAIPLDEARASMDAGRYVWIDLEYYDVGELRRILAELRLISDEVLEDCLSGVPGTQQARYPEYIHLVVTGCRFQRGGAFELQRVDAVIAQKFLLTIHAGRVPFLDSVKREYKDDFERFAKSPSFLLYELWDHLIDDYVRVQKKLEERVEELQLRLIGEVDERVFAEVSEIGVDLLHFRKVLIPARAVLTDLSTRKSIFVSEATQPFLANMVGTLERVLQDLMSDRDILSESLNLYMSMVGHRTNRVMNRLTVVSILFLPLSFLCGVYGMNFEILPELKWEFGYAYFWILAAAIVVGVVAFMRRLRVL
jgi:magnesium transporter